MNLGRWVFVTVLVWLVLGSSRDSLAQQARARVQVEVVVESYGEALAPNDAKWVVELYEGVNCSGRHIGSLLTKFVRLEGILPQKAIGSATFFVKSNQWHSVKLTKKSTQNNYTLPDSTCPAVTVGPGGTWPLSFTPIRKNFPFQKVLETTFKIAVFHVEVATFAFVPVVGWVAIGGAALDAIEILELIQSDPYIVDADFLVHYPEDCYGPAVLSLSALNVRLDTVGQRASQAIEVLRDSVVCYSDPNEKEFFFSLVFGGRDQNYNPMDGLGGCTIAVTPGGRMSCGSIPTLQPIGIALLAVLLISAGGWILRHRLHTT